MRGGGGRKEGGAYSTNKQKEGVSEGGTAVKETRERRYVPEKACHAGGNMGTTSNRDTEGPYRDADRWIKGIKRKVRGKGEGREMLGLGEIRDAWWGPTGKQGRNVGWVGTEAREVGGKVQHREVIVESVRKRRRSKDDKSYLQKLKKQS